jgi:hypothetical protein
MGSGVFMDFFRKLKDELSDALKVLAVAAAFGVVFFIVAEKLMFPDLNLSQYFIIK